MLMSFALFIFGGFDNTEIKNLFSGEKKIRYQFTEKITKIAYIFLIAGLGISVLLEFDSSVFAFYDLGIHFVTIGFIGFTILLYLPIMLPPIINKTIHFIKFNKIPIHLVIAALAMRTIGDFLIIEHAEMRGNEMLNYVFGFSGWLVVAGLFAFVIMLHRSMDSFKSKLKVI